MRVNLPHEQAPPLSLAEQFLSSHESILCWRVFSLKVFSRFNKLLAFFSQPRKRPSWARSTLNHFAPTSASWKFAISCSLGPSSPASAKWSSWPGWEVSPPPANSWAPPPWRPCSSKAISNSWCVRPCFAQIPLRYWTVRVFIKFICCYLGALGFSGHTWTKSPPTAVLWGSTRKHCNRKTCWL